MEVAGGRFHSTVHTAHVYCFISAFLFQEMILPHGKRLTDAENRMVELPFALYESQDLLMQDIVKTGFGGIKKNGVALLGGIQINTAPEALDYFLPLRFDYMDSDFDKKEDLLGKIKK